MNTGMISLCNEDMGMKYVNFLKLKSQYANKGLLIVMKIFMTQEINKLQSHILEKRISKFD